MASRTFPKATAAISAALALSALLAGPVAAGSYPYALISYYMDSTDTGVLYALGCSIGSHRLSGSPPQDGLVILDYGMPKKSGSTYGASAYGGSGGFASTTEIRHAVVEMAHGFWVCTDTDVTAHLRIGVGTSNYSEVGGFSNADITSHGQAWADMVDAINSDMVVAGYNSQADAYGASDLEVSWSTYTRAKRWTDGYDASSSWGYYNNGDAAGCPTSGATATPHQCGTSSWYQDSVYYVSWGNPAAWAVPQIYREDGTQAKQWQQISKYAVLAGQPLGKIQFSGSLTQHSACAPHPTSSDCLNKDNTAASGWQQLYDRANSDSATATEIRFATDINWH